MVSLLSFSGSYTPTKAPRLIDVLLLALLGTTVEQQHQSLAIFAEIDPIAGTMVDPPLRNPEPTGLISPILPASILAIAVRTFSAACVLRRSNQLAKKHSPAAFTYCSTRKNFGNI